MADLTHEIARADRAKAIIQDPIVKDAFERLESELMEGLMMTSAEDEKRREKIHLMLMYGRKWKTALITIIETGKLASLELEEKRKPRLWGLR